MFCNGILGPRGSQRKPLCNGFAMGSFSQRNLLYNGFTMGSDEHRIRNVILRTMDLYWNPLHKGITIE